MADRWTCFKLREERGVARRDAQFVPLRGATSKSTSAYREGGAGAARCGEGVTGRRASVSCTRYTRQCVIQAAGCGAAGRGRARQGRGREKSGSVLAAGTRAPAGKRSCPPGARTCGATGVVCSAPAPAGVLHRGSRLALPARREPLEATTIKFSIRRVGICSAGCWHTLDELQWHEGRLPQVHQHVTVVRTTLID